LSGYRLAREARRDLHEIWDYIARDSADWTDRWVARLHDAFQLIAKNPAIGHTRTDLTNKPLRFWAVERYAIIYRFEGSVVEIVGVTQGGQVTPRFLRRR
jgi:plasmid stabilization system protein ParE